MKHRIFTAFLGICTALTLLLSPALAGDAENETPTPVEEVAGATPAAVERMSVETEVQPLEAANDPSVQANWNDPKINDEYLAVGTYYKNDAKDSRGFSEATADDYNFYFDGTTLFLRNADLRGTGNDPEGSALLKVFIPLVIDLTGENRFSVNASYHDTISASSITIRGSGSLTLTGGAAYITKLTMESGTFITNDIRPASSAEGRGLYFNGGCFTAGHFGGQLGLYIGAEFYRWKTDLSKDYMPSIFETCPNPGGMPLSLVQMENPFSTSLRVNPDTNEWEVSYDGEKTWTPLGVKATGTPGQDGVDGLTPSIGENGNWWIGDTDTGVKAAGTDGENGLTPIIGENGNWWIGDTDTGVKAAGIDGKDGVDGKDGADGQNGTDGTDGLTPSIGGNGNWWIGGTDTGVKAAGTTGAAGAAGAAGAPGAAGRNGADGKDGVGIREVSINDSGELIVVLTDGTESNLGRITGEDGAPGVGISALNVSENGVLTVTFTDGKSVEAGEIPGARESGTVKTLAWIAAASGAFALLWLAVLTALFVKSRRRVYK